MNEYFYNGFIKRANQLGVSTEQANDLLKLARPLGPVGHGPGPSMMEYAINQYEGARSAVRPTDEQLDSRGLSRGAFQKHLGTLASKTQDSKKFNLSDHAPNPKLQGLLGMLGGGALGALGGEDVMGSIGSGLGGAGLGGLAGYAHGAVSKDNYTNTAKMLKDYGMLNPQMLNRAYPLLADHPKFK